MPQFVQRFIRLIMLQVMTQGVEPSHKGGRGFARHHATGHGHMFGGMREIQDPNRIAPMILNEILLPLRTLRHRRDTARGFNAAAMGLD
jgi:hypothetical protein